MDIAAQLRLMRTVRGMTLADMAEATGLSISYMSDLERGRTNPSIETLEKIAECHNMKLFISFVGDMPGRVNVSVQELETLRDIVGRLLMSNKDESEGANNEQ